MSGACTPQPTSTRRLISDDHCRHRPEQELIDEHGYDLGVLVAFSGTVTDDGMDYTEVEMNGFPDSQTAKEYEGQVWIEAETGEVTTIFNGSGRAYQPDDEPLSTIIERFNERFGAD